MICMNEKKMVDSVVSLSSKSRPYHFLPSVLVNMVTSAGIISISAATVKLCQLHTTEFPAHYHHCGNGCLTITIILC